MSCSKEQDLPSMIVVTPGNSHNICSFSMQTFFQVDEKWKRHNQKSNVLALPSSSYGVNGYYNCEISNKFGKVTSNTVKVEYQTNLLPQDIQLA